MGVKKMPFGNPIAERAAIELTYEDTATFSRSSAQVGENSISTMVPAPIYTDIICGLSYGSDRSKQTDAQQNVEYDAMLFIAPECDIHPGDSVTVKRYGRDNPGSTITHKFEVVGRPPVYMTHQEVPAKFAGIS